ncbi:VOC family protein [Cellulomonas soli]|uniref:VOC family protein n=1 Tax=Cellulomonas soli TaxID=931535 RepID=UPI003F83B35D
MPEAFPTLVQVVLDTTDARALAEFYRRLLGWDYAPGHDEVDPAGDDWLNLRNPTGGVGLAFQQVESLPPSTWPGTEKPQQLHLDLTVPDVEALTVQRDRAIGLGARVLLDRTDDPDEPLYVFADPAGHPFCIFVG